MALIILTNTTIPVSLREKSNEPNDFVTLTRQRKIYEVAVEIRKTWGAKVNFAAKPYLDAMTTLTDKNSKYICDNATDIVLRFLCNATGWRGEDAKRLKAELKSIVGVK